MIADYIQEIDSSISSDKAIDLSGKALGATGVKVGKDNVTGYLLFVSTLQAMRLAELALDYERQGADIDKKKAKSILNVKESPKLNSVDIALFGRMVADDPSLNVDAAVQVSHALGISRAETEYDYFTAMDDRSPADNAGAAMIETTEFLSSTFYRYAVVDVYHLCENLGSFEMAQRAIDAFIRSFLTAMPTGKQNSFANRTLPGAILVQLRDTLPVTMADAFERPVHQSSEKSNMKIACERLIDKEARINKSFCVEPLASFVIPVDEDAEILGNISNSVTCNLEELLEGVKQKVGSYLADSDLPSGIEEQ